MSRDQRDEPFGETEKRLRSFAAGLWTTMGFAGLALALTTYGIIRGVLSYRNKSPDVPTAERSVEEDADLDDRSHVAQMQEGTSDPKIAR